MTPINCLSNTLELEGAHGIVTVFQSACYCGCSLVGRATAWWSPPDYVDMETACLLCATQCSRAVVAPSLIETGGSQFIARLKPIVVNVTHMESSNLQYPAPLNAPRGDRPRALHLHPSMRSTASSRLLGTTPLSIMSVTTRFGSVEAKL